MSNDKFRVWEFKNELTKDADIRVTFGLNNSASGAGAADPSTIDFS
jgi:UDP-N-acetyl-2-amino-2-deoxyglucuronate dehydrogenase